MESLGQNVPLFVPVLLLSFFVGLATCAPLGRAMGVGRLQAWLIVASLGLVLAATLTPRRAALESGARSLGHCDLSRLTPAAWSTYLSGGEAAGNVLMFVPLGLLIGILSGRRRVILLAAAIVLPLAIEAIQLLVPGLDRACESGDVVDNLVGLAVGVAVAGVLRAIGRLLPRSGCGSR